MFKRKEKSQLDNFTSIIHLFIDEMKKEIHQRSNEHRFYQLYSQNSSTQKESKNGTDQPNHKQYQQSLNFNVWKNNLERQAKQKLSYNCIVDQHHPFTFDIKECKGQIYTPKQTNVSYQKHGNQNKRFQNYQHEQLMKKRSNHMINNIEKIKTSSNEKIIQKYSFTGPVISNRVNIEPNYNKTIINKNQLNLQSHEKLLKILKVGVQVKTPKLQNNSYFKSNQNLGINTTKCQQTYFHLNKFADNVQNKYKSHETLFNDNLCHSYRHKQCAANTTRFLNNRERSQRGKAASSRGLKTIPVLQRGFTNNLFMNKFPICNEYTQDQQKQNQRDDDFIGLNELKLRKYESEQIQDLVLPQNSSQNSPNKYSNSLSLQQKFESNIRSKSKNLPDFLINKFKKNEQVAEKSRQKTYQIQKQFKKLLTDDSQINNHKNVQSNLSQQNYTVYNRRINETNENPLFKKKANIALKIQKTPECSTLMKFYTPSNQQKKNILNMALEKLKKQYSIKNFQNRLEESKRNARVQSKTPNSKQKNDTHKMFKQLLEANKKYPPTSKASLNSSRYNVQIDRRNKTHYQQINSHPNPQLFCSKKLEQTNVARDNNPLKKKSRRFSQPDLFEQFGYAPKNNANKLIQAIKSEFNQGKTIQKQLNQTQQTKSSFKTLDIQNNLKLSDFELGQELGRGKFGIVVQAIHKKTGFLFALKTLSKNVIKKQNVFGQIVRQVKIQYFMDHPHLVKLYGIFDDAKNIYLLQQYCIDGQLYKILQNQVKFNEVDTSIIMKEICEGVMELHKYDIIHRDLKPQNIVINFGMCKICDFGWSIQNTNNLRQTLCGTPLYFSPQLIVEGSYNQKVDLWALGIMAYQLLNGNIPFDIKSHRQLIKIATNEVIYPPSMSSEAISFVKMLLQKNPTQRVEIRTILKHNFFQHYYAQSDSSRSKSAVKLMNRK